MFWQRARSSEREGEREKGREREGEKEERSGAPYADALALALHALLANCE